MKSLAVVAALFAAAALCADAVRPAHSQNQVGGNGATFAVAEIQYVDTSGEANDQGADHQRRLREFEASLRTDLSASGKMRDVGLDCPPSACSLGDVRAAQLLDKAKAAGASYLLVGRFHKMSTLIQQAQFDVIDVREPKIVFSRYVTFRGDNDDAWRRAETFVARQIIDHNGW